MLHFSTAGVVLVLQGLDAGSHSVHMGLLPQELILEGLNFHIILFDFALLFAAGRMLVLQRLDAGCQWLPVVAADTHLQGATWAPHNAKETKNYAVIYMILAILWSDFLVDLFKAPINMQCFKCF